MEISGSGEIGGKITQDFLTPVGLVTSLAGQVSSCKRPDTFSSVGKREILQDSFFTSQDGKR